MSDTNIPTEKKDFQLDKKMEAIYMDMVTGPDFSNRGGLTAEEWEYHDKRVAEVFGEKKATDERS